MTLQTRMLTTSRTRRRVIARGALIAAVVALHLVGIGCDGNQFDDETVTIDPSRRAGVPDGAGPDMADTFNPPPVYLLSAGPATRVAEQAVSPNGGLVAVHAPGSSADGLSIEIPPGSYDRTVNFTVSAAPVDNFDSLIPLTPISPVFTIDNGGEYSRNLMKITIPAVVAEGHFAMPFVYDPKTGSLDGLPVLSIDQRGVTAVTRHFCQILLLQTPTSLFTGRIDSAFRVDRDSWPFPNEGSWWSPRGICSGMSLGAVWYFQNYSRLGLPRLRSAHDTETFFSTPDFSGDDAWGLRFASRVQVDEEATGDDDRLLEAQQAELERDESEYYANAWFSILVNLATTLQPQYVSIFSNNDEGHAIVAWGASVEDRRLYVYDPNYPEQNDRFIQFTDTGIDAYVSTTRVDDENPTKIEFTSLFPTLGTAVIDPKLIPTAWADRGKRNPGTKPALPYRLLVKMDDGTEEPLVDGYQTDSDELEVKITGGSDAFLGFDTFLPVGGVVPPPGARVPIDTNEFIIHGALQDQWNDPLPLRDGENVIGFQIEGVNQKRLKTHRAWLDFRWIRVFRSSMVLVPQALSVSQGSVGTFRASLTREAPADFSWFVDGAPLPGVGNGPEATIMFDRPGEFTVRAEATVKGEEHSATAESRVVVGTLVLSVDKTPVAVGEKVVFNVEAKPAPKNLEYTWRLPDRRPITGTNPSPKASFKSPGNKEVHVDVRDRTTGLLWGSASVRVAVVQKAVPEIDWTRDPKVDVGIPDTIRDIPDDTTSGSGPGDVNAKALHDERNALANQLNALILQNRTGSDEFKRINARIKEIDRLLGQ